MCPKLIELLSWNGPTVHVCCFMLARASTKTFVSRIHIRQQRPKNSEKNLRQPKNSLAGSLVSRGITVHIYLGAILFSFGIRCQQLRTIHLSISNSQAPQSPFEMDSNHFYICNYNCFYVFSSPQLPIVALEPHPIPLFNGVSVPSRGKPARA